MNRSHTLVRPQPDQRGFTIIELMVVMAILLIISVAAFSTFDTSMLNGDLSQSVADTDENVRGSMTFMVRDFIAAGSDITLGGIPVPSSFLPSNVFYPIVPGANQGPTINGQQTDTVMIVYNQIALQGLDSNQADVNYIVNGAGSIDRNGQWMVLNTTAPNPTTSSLKPGDILLIKASSGGTVSALGYITAVPNSSTINFYTGDPLSLNATGYTSPVGALNCQNQGQPAGCTDSAVAFKVNIVRYYIDNGGPNPLLMRRFNGLTPTQLGINIENLKITYTLADGTVSANPTNPENIRKASIYLIGRSGHTLDQDRAYYRFPMTSDVSTRNLAYLRTAQ